MGLEEDNTDQWFFLETPAVWFAGSTFINVPTILKVDDTRLIQIVDYGVQSIPAGYTIEFEIYNKDGVYVAKVKGSRLHLTPDGEKSNLKLRHPNRMTVCELDGKTLFEMRREEAAALKTSAELYTQNGSFVRGNDREGLICGEALTCIQPAIPFTGKVMEVTSTVMKRQEFKDIDIGFQVKST